LGIALVLYGANVLGHWYYRVDDAYIYFRYARHWAAGLGPVFNPGQFVEGFTSPLWTALLMVAFHLQADPLWTARLASIAAALAVFVFTVQMLRWSYPQPSWVWAVPALLLAVNLSFALYSVSGLETMAFTFAMLMAVAGSYWWWQRPTWRRSLGWGGILGSMTFLRPEGFVVAGLCGLYAIKQTACQASQERKKRLIALIFVGWAAMVPVALLLLWRWQTYGRLLPNTFFAKMYGNAFTTLSPAYGAVYSFTALIATGLPLILITVWLSRYNQTGPQPFLSGLWGTLLLGWLILVIWEGGDWMPGYRYWVPVLPLLYLIFAERLENVRLPTRSRLESRCLKAGLVLAMLALSLVDVRQAQQDLQAFVRNLERRWAFAEWLNRVVPPGPIAYSDMGIVPYLVERPFLDLNGLTDETIARSSNPSEYVLAQKPTLVILVAIRRPREVPVSDTMLFQGNDRLLFSDPRFAEQYTYLTSAPSFEPGESKRWFPDGRYLLVYSRRDLVSLPPYPSTTLSKSGYYVTNTLGTHTSKQRQKQNRSHWVGCRYLGFALPLGESW
jgi:hypothetical protein